MTPSAIIHDNQRVYNCVHCGCEVEELYHSYSPTVLKICECAKCKLPADEYVECDLALVLLNLFLQKLPAYRHVLFNSALKNAWRLLLIFILCDAYYNWVETNAASGGRKAVDIYDLEWHFYVNIVQASVEVIFTIIVMALFCLWIWYNRDDGSPNSIVPDSPIPSIRSILQAIVNKLQVGFYGNVLVLLAVVWEQHHSTSFMVLTRIFLFVSHVQVFRALANVGFLKAAPIVGLAMGMGKLARYLTVLILNGD